MRIGGRREGEDDDAVPKGPWSDLPPPAPPPRQPLLKPRPSARRREPIIGNWRGLLIVLFLLLVAPILARVASGMILGLFPGH